MFVDLTIFILGLLLLIVSSDLLIQGCLRLSVLLKLTPLFMGLIIVAFGTSAPEAGVGIIAAIRNEKDIALGNIIGSNIANIGLIIGVCSIFRPLHIEKSLFRQEIPIMLFSSFLLIWICWDRVISRMDGLILIILFLFFCCVSYLGARKGYEDKGEFELKSWIRRLNSVVMLSVMILIFIGGIVYGADMMVRTGVSLGKRIGVSPLVIAMVAFAIGTSLPEFAASLIAVVKDVAEISVGNIVGSNIFNILFVLGVVALIRPIELPFSLLKFELPAMIIFALMFTFFPLLNKEYKISRFSGLIIFLSYTIFIILLFV